MYSSAASGDHLSERVSDIPGDQVSNASNATISGADTRWVLICAHAHAGSCMNAQTCTCAQNCHFRESSLPCQNDRKCCATELRAHSRRTTLHILARARAHTHGSSRRWIWSLSPTRKRPISQNAPCLMPNLRVISLVRMAFFVLASFAASTLQQESYGLCVVSPHLNNVNLLV